jgi:hypothetical protein
MCAGSTLAMTNRCTQQVGRRVVGSTSRVTPAAAKFNRPLTTTARVAPSWQTTGSQQETGRAQPFETKSKYKRKSDGSGSFYKKIGLGAALLGSGATGTFTQGWEERKAADAAHREKLNTLIEISYQARQHVLRSCQQYPIVVKWLSAQGIYDVGAGEIKKLESLEDILPKIKSESQECASALHDFISTRIAIFEEINRHLINQELRIRPWSDEEIPMVQRHNAYIENIKEYQRMLK